MLPHVAPCVASDRERKHPCSAERKRPYPEPCAEMCSDAKTERCRRSFAGAERLKNFPQSCTAGVRRRCRTSRPVSRFAGRGGIPAPKGWEIGCPGLCGATCERTEAAILGT